MKSIALRIRKEHRTSKYHDMVKKKHFNSIHPTLWCKKELIHSLREDGNVSIKNN